MPSLINPPQVLDLARGNSLLRWLARQGVRPMLVDWGTPTPTDRAQDVDAHVESLLLPLLAQLRRPPLLVGYCLGGTIALAAAAASEAAGVALIAAPWRFAGYGETLAPIAAIWEQAQPTCEALGLVPIEVLQSGFWRLDPARTVAKFEHFGRLPPASPAARAFVALEDWANGGAPLPYAAGRQMFEAFFRDDLPGRGRWQVAGARVDPRALACPSVEFIAGDDRIVPAASAARLVDSRRVGAGHVGMIVGRRGRAALWEPLADWLRTARGSR